MPRLKDVRARYVVTNFPPFLFYVGIVVHRASFVHVFRRFGDVFFASVVCLASSLCFFQYISVGGRVRRVVPIFRGVVYVSSGSRTELLFDRLWGGFPLYLVRRIFC